jgi:hypothetical protein
MLARLLLLSMGVLLCSIPPIASADMASGVAAFQKEDYHTAYQELRPLAEAGDLKAQYYIGFMLYSGKGASQNGPEAVKWVKPAAENGVADAQYLFALMTEAGLAGPKEKKQTRKMESINKAEAVKWFTSAAEQGHINAQVKLVDRYLQGEGVQRDVAQAYAWCGIAHLLAPSRCNPELQVPGYQMAPAQLEDAKQRVREWVAKYSASAIPPSANTAQQLIAELDTAPSKRREEIKSSLVLMGDAGLPAMLGMFGAKAPKHVDFLTGVLCERGTAAASAAPELIRLFKDQAVSSSIKHHFLQALACVGKTSVQAQTLLVSLVKSGDDAIRPWAVMSLERFHSPEAVAALAGALSDPRRSVREAAAEVLSKMGPKAAPAVPALTKAIAQKGTYLSMLAGNALRAIGTPEALAEVKKHEHDNDLGLSEDTSDSGAAVSISSLDGR